MTAVGGPEVLKLAELPEPQISGDHDVKVRLRVPAGVRHEYRCLELWLAVA